MTIFNVSNVTQLENALTSAHGGDTVELAAGTYSGLGTLSGLNYASDVTITSANASNQAVIAPFYLENSSNLTFSNITFNVAGSTDPYANRVYSSTGVSFDHDTFQGNLSGSVSSEPMDGIGFFSSSNVSVTNSDFNHLADGIANTDTNGGVFSDNSFHEIRTDGIDNSSSANEQILNNVFTDFSPASGDHPDAIQVWGSTSDPSHDITISGNLYVRGAGAPIQGVFSNNNPGEASNLTVTHNTIIGGMYNGIAVMGASNVTLQSNTVEAYSASQDSSIRLQNNSGLHETGDAAYEYQTSGNTSVTQSGNGTISTLADADGGSALVSQWASAHSGWTGTLPASVSSMIGSTGSGSTGGGSTGSGSTGTGSTGSGSGSHSGGTTYNVSNVTQLEHALTSAHGGDTIALAAGTYSGLGALSGLNYSSDVTITSADPSHQAAIAPFYLENSSNLTFSNITFNVAGSTDPYANRVYSSTGVSFDHDTFQGNLSGSVSSEPMDGIGFFSSSNVSVTNSDFNHLADGIANTDTNGGVFSDNSFHEIRTDGIDNSSSANEQILNNVFTDFSPASGDHPDAIQVWGSTSNPSHDITISGNLYVRGAGAPIQGVFSNNNPGEASNLTVTHNTIIGGMYNGIAVMGASNVTLQSNTVEAYSASQDSSIRLQNISGLHETGNAAYEYQSSGNTSVTQSGNGTISTLADADGGSALVNQWAAAHSGWTGTLPASVSSMISSTGSGSTGGGSTGSGSTGSGSTGSGSGSHSGGTTYNVSNVSQLEHALTSAHGGDTIALAAGSYSGLGALSGLNYSSDVTITSADPTHQAVITPFYLENSSNLAFSDITFNAAGSTDPYAYRVYSSTGVSFDGDTFHGNMSGSVSSEPMDGIGFFSSSNVSVTNSDFNHLADGIANTDTNGGVFSDNSFHQISSDGIDNSSSGNLQILNNVFTDFSPASGDHPDAIQVWGTTSDPSHDISISGNLIERGSGAAIQGIFSNDNPGEANNLTISHNTVIGGMYNGIAVMGASNVTLQSNTVEAYSASQDSAIRLQNINGLTETGNTAYEYQTSGNTHVSQSGNTTDSQLSHTDGGQSLVNQWVSTHPDFHGFY